ncbi:MAG: hypothetical protein HKN21_02370, partial [Candidatus Eisenbacteria bacterium]|nr:hypothetical protein [Candidatus Eisenbacteria bacterium]
MSAQTPGELFRHWARVMRARVEYNEVRKDSLFKLIPVSLAFVYGKTLPSDELKRMAGEALRNHLVIKRTNLNVVNETSLHNTPGIEHLAPLAKAGKGAVICGVHLGPYHFMTSAVARAFGEIGIFAAPSFAMRGESWAQAGKALGSNVTVLPSDHKSSLLRAMRILKRGGAIVIFVDIANNVGEDTAENTVAIEFMNLPMRVRIGAAYMSQAAQSPMVYAATWLGKWGSRHVTFSEPSPPVP